MKLALARAMLQRADILLLDEPTNHLDVINVAWVENYLCSLANVTSIMVSANAGVLDKCCTHILQIEDLKLKCVKGNLSHFVSLNPKAASSGGETADLRFVGYALVLIIITAVTLLSLLLLGKIDEVKLPF